MFQKYHNLDTYVPDNTSCPVTIGASYTKLENTTNGACYENYDIKGNLIGYVWNYGETLTLEFNIDGIITVESNALIFEKSGEEPLGTTIGFVGQKAYNIIDLKSWTCVAAFSDHFIWSTDDEFTYDDHGTNQIIVSAADYMRDKKAKLVVYNFRHEPLIEQEFEGQTKILFEIDKELSQTLRKGVYYCDLIVFNDKTSVSVFSTTDCSFLVK